MLKTPAAARASAKLSGTTVSNSAIVAARPASGMASSNLKQEMDMYVSQELIALVPPRGDSGSGKKPAASQRSLVIERASGNIVLRDAPHFPDGTLRQRVYGVLGVIKLLGGYYLVLVTKRQELARIGADHVVYAVAETRIIAFSHTYAAMSEQQRADEDRYLGLLDSVLKAPGLMFSYTYDLTRRMQQQAAAGSSAGKSRWSQCDERFFFNYSLQKPLMALDLDEYILPLVSGFVHAETQTWGDAEWTWILLSRRSRHRQGARMYRRGVNAHGETANYVETEQIVLAGASRLSFVQTRGSVPVFWQQTPHLVYKPDMALLTGKDHQAGFTAHMAKEVKRFGQVICVHLADQKGREKDLFVKFKDLCTSYGEAVKFVAFDFHQRCRKMQWQNLDQLMEELDADITSQGWFEASAEEPLMMQQSAVIRSNCIDSLDRTNVVQAMIANIVLERQLRHLGILPEAGKLRDHPAFVQMQRNVWTDHADLMSILYTGTPALKTDFTRTGKRTKPGALRDLSNSIRRYVMNNYFDGARQDAWDLFMGNVKVQKRETSPFAGTPALTKLAVVLTMLMVVAMMLDRMLLGADSVFVLRVLLFLAVYAVAIKYVLFPRGRSFTDEPKLHPDVLGHAES